MEVEWPFLLCILEVIVFLIAAIFVVYKYEAPLKRIRRHYIDGVASLDRNQLFYCCDGKLSPIWLCIFRTSVFLYLLSVQVYNAVADGPFVYFFYTQWTFTLLIIYFGIAAYVSAKELIRSKSNEENILIDEEIGNLTDEQRKTETETHANTRQRAAGFLGYIMIVIFQVVAAACVLTDAVYWFILVPFVLNKGLEFKFINLNMHAINGVILLVEFFLNSMPFPWFRGAYFVFWSATYVIFQWTIHATGYVRWWPYPFLEVKTHVAPAWYFGLAVGHLIAFLVCLLLAKIKKPIMSRLSS